MDPPYVVRKTVSIKPTLKYEFYKATKSSPKNKPKVGSKITSPKQITYLKSIKVPPTYDNVLLSLNPKSTLQGTGYDGSGQKQYFYSEKAITSRSKDKYCNLVYLGKYLNKIQVDIDKLLSSKTITDQVLNALALKVMFVCNFRIGHQKNLKDHHTYGLTTINGEHLTLKKSQAWIKFVGKKKQWNLCLIEDKQILQFLRQLAKNYRNLDRKGQKASTNTLFTWNGYKVTPKSLNSFLANYHPEITSKTWRTWYANVEYIRRIDLIQIPELKTYRQKASNLVIRSVAEDLHHTPAISKRNYLVKNLPELFVEDPSKWKQLRNKTRSAESMLLLFLKTYCQD